MPILPGSYVTGIVVLNTMVSHGDLDGDTFVEASVPDGVVVFAPVNPVYKAQTIPTILVGNETITVNVTEGELRNAKGDPWVAIPLGEWRVSFTIPGLPVASTIVEVRMEHTKESPLDLGARVTPTSVSLINETSVSTATSLVITDTGDGGAIIASQDFTYQDGSRGTLTVVDDGDGGGTITVT